MPSVVMSSVTSQCHQFKILQPIVASVVVLVMHDLMRLEIAAHLCLHHETMLQYEILVSVWMGGDVSQYIAIATNPSPTLPSAVTRSTAVNRLHCTASTAMLSIWLLVWTTALWTVHGLDRYRSLLEALNHILIPKDFRLL